jgi:hypothetical protein
MAALSVHAEALALFDWCADEGVTLSLHDGGRLLVTADNVSDALRDRLSAFCGAHEGREGLLTYRALRDIVRAPSRAARELLTLAVGHAVGLPVPFVVTFVRGGQRCVCSTSREAYQRAVREGHPAFVLRELEVAALVVEQGRASPRDLDLWLLAKKRGDWRLTPEFAGALEAQTVQAGLQPAITFGDLFDALGAELVDVELPATEAA